MKSILAGTLMALMNTVAVAQVYGTPPDNALVFLDHENKIWFSPPCLGMAKLSGPPKPE